MGKSNENAFALDNPSPTTGGEMKYNVRTNIWEYDKPMNLLQAIWKIVLWSMDKKDHTEFIAIDRIHK
jgi:hypothetical protein